MSVPERLVDRRKPAHGEKGYFVADPANAVPQKCGNCGRKTTMQNIARGRCPACALYIKTHGKERPATLYKRAGLFSGSAEERYFSRVRIGALDECWPWLGSTAGAGYGALRVDGKQIWAHRYTYEYWTGSIPPDYTIDHLCFNRCCQNPAHLEAVTRGENSRRGMRRRYGG